MKKRYGFLLFAAFVVGFILWAMLYQAGMLGGGKVPPGEKAGVLAAVDGKWVTLEPVRIPVVYTAVGAVRSREEITVISRLLSARIVEVGFRAGESFQKGDVLIRLEDKDLKAQEEAAKENLNGAESRLEFARSEYDRNAKLIETQAVARRAYEQAQSNLNAARAEFAMMKHEWEAARSNLEYATIRAPFNGIVFQRDCEPGDLATPLNALLKIFNPAKLQIRVPVRESLYRAIRIGETLAVEVESSGKTYKAEVQEIVPSVDARSRMFVVNGRLEGDTAGLMPGMFATCEIPVGEKDALLVPAPAVLRIGQLEYLTLRSQQGTPVRQLVRTVPSPRPGMLEIVSGVSAGMAYLSAAE